MRNTRRLSLPLLLCIASLLAACAWMPTRVAIPFDRRPVAAADPGSAMLEGWQHGPFMEIFVRGYRDSNGDGIGDLRGLIQSLDYLQALGIRGLWLMPITRSADGDHGYAVSDFRAIDTAYGTMDDFDELLREAHKRGIGVVMDYVLNHAAQQHPAFQLARSAKDSPLRAWFVWQDPPPAGWSIFEQNPWYDSGNGHYFSTFGAAMPDFNFRHPAVLAWHEDNLRFWLNRGLDGFRFDAVTHLVENDAQQWNDQPESHAILHRVQQLVAGYRHRYMVCEAPASPQRWASADSCGAAFAFGLEHRLIGAARAEPEAIRELAAYFTSAPPTMATMLANHDLFAGARVWDQLKGDTAAYRLAAASYLLLPGTPFLYYGEEIGMAGVPTLKGDAQLRTPMSWTADGSGFSSGTPFRPLSPNAATNNVAAAQADPRSLLAFYRQLLALRNQQAPLARGRYAAPQVEGSVFSFRRQLGDEQVLVLINYGREAASMQLTGLGANSRWSNEYPAGGALSQADAAGVIRFGLAGQSLRVLRLQR